MKNVINGETKYGVYENSQFYFCSIFGKCEIIKNKMI